MRTEDVKLAIVAFEFKWLQGGRRLEDWTIASEQYFRDYDRCEPVTDPHHLAQIRASGLERELEVAAWPVAKGAHWFERPRRKRGLGYKEVWLAANEWLPVMFGPNLFGEYQRGLTSLMRAALHGDAPQIRRLLESGADVNAIAPDGSTALEWAASVGGSEAVKALLDGGATMNANPKGRGNALVAAVANGQAKSVQLLLQAGANANSMNAEGETVLAIALRKRYVQIVLTLKEFGGHE